MTGGSGRDRRAKTAGHTSTQGAHLDPGLAGRLVSIRLRLLLWRWRHHGARGLRHPAHTPAGRRGLASHRLGALFPGFGPNVASSRPLGRRRRRRVAGRGAWTALGAAPLAVALLAAMARRPVPLGLLRRFTLVRPLVASFLLATAAPLTWFAPCFLDLSTTQNGGPGLRRLRPFASHFAAPVLFLPSAQDFDACEQRHREPRRHKYCIAASSCESLPPATPPGHGLSRRGEEGSGRGGPPPSLGPGAASPPHPRSGFRPHSSAEAAKDRGGGGWR